ncbi:protein of unknown function [Thauera humireducens]|nr:protein of unknown function [Thauera humireducens]
MRGAVQGRGADAQAGRLTASPVGVARRTIRVRRRTVSSHCNGARAGAPRRGGPRQPGSRAFPRAGPLFAELGA